MSKRKELNAIARILGKPKVPEYYFKFGKYNGELLEDIIHSDKKYIEWLSNRKNLDPVLTNILERLNAKS